MSSKKYTLKQQIFKLSPNKGGYYHLVLNPEIVSQFSKEKASRLKCIIDGLVELSCGLNHLGDGNFYIIVAGRHLKKLKKQEGDEVTFTVFEDSNPLGIEEPEVLQVLLAHDEEAKDIYSTLTDGRKRTLIFSIIRIKNIDIQIQKITDFLLQEKIKQLKKKN